MSTGPVGPDAPLSPADTVTVYGATGVAAVESDSVRRAAASLTSAASDLRGASVRCLGAGGDLVLPGADWSGAGRAWTGAAGFGTFGRARAEAVAQHRALEAAAQDTARRLAQRADRCDLLAWRLLRAAGLYEEAESTAQRLVGALVTAGSFGVGAGLGQLGGAGLVGIAGLGGAELAARTAGGALARGLSGPVTVATGWVGTTATRGLAPFSDEVFAGAGSGVALAQPGLAGYRPGVAGGAGVLAHVARTAPVVGNDDGEVRVMRVGPEAFADGAAPAWSGSGASSVRDALARIDDLYPHTGGAPAATIAVQRVTGSEGATSWTVLVPGTQSVLPADHPLDGRTDLELMAGGPDGATVAIERALEKADVGPDEPVTLVGHSLGGIAAATLISRAGFAERYRVAGLVTAGAPTGLIATPPGVPVLHLATPEELVSHSDGRSAAENPRTSDRVTVVRTLGDSSDAGDRAASGDVVRAHAVTTHVRTLDLALDSGDQRVTEVTDRIGARLDGTAASTTFYRAERVSR